MNCKGGKIYSRFLRDMAKFKYEFPKINCNDGAEFWKNL